MNNPVLRSTTGNGERRILVPNQYRFVRYQWRCEIEGVKPNGEVDVYEIKANGKILLDEFIPHIRKSIGDLFGNVEVEEIEFRIYK